MGKENAKRLRKACQSLTQGRKEDEEDGKRQMMSNGVSSQVSDGTQENSGKR